MSHIFLRCSLFVTLYSVFLSHAIHYETSKHPPPPLFFCFLFCPFFNVLLSHFHRHIGRICRALKSVWDFQAPAHPFGQYVCSHNVRVHKVHLWLLAWVVKYKSQASGRRFEQHSTSKNLISLGSILSLETWREKHIKKKKAACSRFDKHFELTTWKN